MAWKNDEEIRKLRQEIKDLREDINLKDSKNPADRIWARLKHETYSTGPLLVYDVVGAVIRTVNSGEIGRKEMIKFFGLDKKENN